MYSFLFHLLPQTNVLVDELLEMGVVVIDAPPLIDDDEHKREYYHDEGSGKGDGNDESGIHIFAGFNVSGAKLATASKMGVSLAEKCVPNQERMPIWAIFCDILRGSCRRSSGIDVTGCSGWVCRSARR